MTERVSLCIATYRRPKRLAMLIRDLAQSSQLPDQVVIVDNDGAGGARAVVEAALAEGLPFPIDYAIQPARNIALTRNKTVELATGDWLGFLDDDERVPPTWLETMLSAARRFHADAVLGPVIPVVPDEAPGWIRRGRFYDFPRMQTGQPVALNLMRFGNVLIRAEPLRGLPGPFDVRYELRTGEDGDMLLRFVERGAQVVWCDEAQVTEPVEGHRLTLRWILQRALSGGQEYARKHLAGRYGHSGVMGRAQLFLGALTRLVLSGMLAVVTLPLGRHRSAHWLSRGVANFGKLSVFSGWVYNEYAQSATTDDPSRP